MMVRSISCEVCGCAGKAGNTFIRGNSEEVVFAYLGHDPYTGNMYYRCPDCAAFLLVDPMEILSNSSVKGLQCNDEPAFFKAWKDKILLSSEQLLGKTYKEIQTR